MQCPDAQTGERYEFWTEGHAGVSARSIFNRGSSVGNERRASHHATAAIPCFSTRDRSLRAGPDGRFSPRSHLLTRFGVTLR